MKQIFKINNKKINYKLSFKILNYYNLSLNLFNFEEKKEK